MPEWALRKRAFREAETQRLLETLLRSPLVARSTLAGSFRHSRGFALTFTRDGLPELSRRFPEVLPFVERALERNPRLQRFSEWLTRKPARECNAFYVNLLLIEPGGAVGRHTDATLRGPSGEANALPERVSVLYLSVPSSQRGGTLQLYRGERRVGRIAPRVGALLHFRGDLAHEVTEVSGEGLRASLVCEQYALPTSALERLAPLHVQSKAGFDAFLSHHRSV